jgi:hypothetical protein
MPATLKMADSPSWRLSLGTPFRREPPFMAKRGDDEPPLWARAARACDATLRGMSGMPALCLCGLRPGADRIAEWRAPLTVVAPGQVESANDSRRPPEIRCRF